MEVHRESNCANATVEDRSQLNLPISTGVSGIHQVMRCIQGGTAEVRDLLFNECELVYECRVCRSLFRSLANFLYHKREFCRKHMCENMVLFTSEEAPQEVVIVHPESPKETVVENGDIDMEDFVDQDIGIPPELPEGLELPKLGICTSRIFQAVEKTDKCKHTDDVTETWHTKDCNAKSSSAVAFYSKCANSVKLRSSQNIKKSVVSLKPIDSNPNAVFQSIKNISQKSKADMKSEEEEEEPMTIAEVREKLEASKTAVVHVENANFHPRQRQRYYSDNTKSVMARLQERDDCNVNTLNCRLCKTQYMSVKTLDFHMRTIHSDKRLYYPCPFCKTLFVQLWGVTRHMTSVHKKTKEQISKLREVVRKRAFRKNIAKSPAKSVKKGSPKVSAAIKVDRSPKKKIVSVHQKTVLKNPKVKTEVHICKTCGRSFNRKSSHSTHEKYCSKGPKPKQAVERSRSSANSDSPKSAPHVQLAKTNNSPANSKDTNGRPKRSVKKKEKEDFVDSSAIGYSRISQKADSPVRQPVVETLEKNLLGIISTRHLQCLKCKRRFSTFSNLRRHAAIHVGWNRFKCKYCDYQVYSRSDCRNHIQRIHLQGKLSQNTIDKLVIDLPSQQVQVKKENADLVANENKNDLALWVTQPSMQPSLTIKLTKTLPQVSIPVTPTKLAEQKSKLSSSPSSRIMSKPSKNNLLPSETASITPSPVIASSSPYPYGVSTRHTPRNPAPKTPVTPDDISTLVTRSGMYRKTYLVNKQLENKTNMSNSRLDRQESETFVDVENDDSDDQIIPDHLYSNPECETSDIDPKCVTPIPEQQETENGHIEEMGVPSESAVHNVVVNTVVDS